jgi:threonine/homoserine/homoserine lactone efflux protein
MNELFGLAGFALAGMITPGPNNSLLLAVPGAELAVKLAGSAYLLYLAFRTATSHGAGGAALHRLVAGGAAQRALNGALAVVLAASVALIWV